MIDEAIKQVERDMAAARREMHFASDAYSIASARFMGLVNELVSLCEAKNAARLRRRDEGEGT